MNTIIYSSYDVYSVNTFAIRYTNNMYIWADG